MRRFNFECRDCAPANGFFDPLEKRGTVIVPLARPDDQMNMVRHDDIGPEGAVKFGLGNANRVRKPSTSPVFR